MKRHVKGRHPAADEAAQRVRAVVAAPDELSLHLLCLCLATRWDVDVCGGATSASSAAALIARHCPDVLVTTAALPDAGGLALLPGLAAADPGARAIVIAGGQALVRTRREAAAWPQVLGVVDAGEGLAALAGVVERWLRSSGRLPLDLRVRAMLSPREMDVFEGIGHGQSSAAIAAVLAISHQTVETHRKSITRKTGAKGAGLVRLAVRHVMRSMGEVDVAAPGRDGG